MLAAAPVRLARRWVTCCSGSREWCIWTLQQLACGSAKAGGLRRVRCLPLKPGNGLTGPPNQGCRRISGMVMRSRGSRRRMRSIRSLHSSLTLSGILYAPLMMFCEQTRRSMCQLFPPHAGHDQCVQFERCSGTYVLWSHSYKLTPDTWQPALHLLDRQDTVCRCVLKRISACHQKEPGQQVTGDQRGSETSQQAARWHTCPQGLQAAEEASRRHVCRLSQDDAAGPDVGKLPVVPGVHITTNCRWLKAIVAIGIMTL